MIAASVLLPEPKQTLPGISRHVDMLLQNVMADGEKKLALELARLQALGIIDENGSLLNKDLPPDMQPGADRDFGG